VCCFQFNLFATTTAGIQSCMRPVAGGAACPPSPFFDVTGQACNTSSDCRAGACVTYNCGTQSVRACEGTFNAAITKTCTVD
jgi:hypothetical protein